MSRVPSKYAPSVVGLRSMWTCALCKRTELNFQIISVTHPQLAAPHGWYVENGHANCGRHEAREETTFAEGAD